MRYEDILRELASLPPESQREAADFIALLHKRYSRLDPIQQLTRDLASLNFVGMWRDREDMRNSTAWVRKLRSGQ